MAKLDHPFPSSPSRPPKYHISFSHGDKLLQSVGFGAAYSARIFIETVVGENEIKWRGDDSFHIEDIGVTVKGTGLEDIMEHDLTKAEEDWELPDPYLGDATAIATGERRKIKAARPSDSAGPDGSGTERKKRDDDTPKTERKASKPRASADGLTTLAQICEDIGMEPREARVILRKSDTKKPDAGWAWDPKEAAKVKATLSGKGKDNGGDKTPVKRNEVKAAPSKVAEPAKGKVAAAKRKTRR